MPYTLGDLKAEQRPLLFPTGEAENLVAAHDAMFVDALMDLQQWVDCLQINNTETYPQCNTLFNCGLTVIDAPRGRLNRLYTIDKINQTTGLEDPGVPLDWCSEVDYRRVDYSDLERYVSQTLAGTVSEGFWPWAAGLFGVFSLNGQFAFPTMWLEKYTFPPPTDAGLSKAPPLPLGYHYGQPSTDAPNAQRAQWGLWAVKGGQIFVAPWIQSTEMIIVEWNGLKRNWQDTDLVDNDPILKLAVQEYVRMEHARKYDRDFDVARAAEGKYNEHRQRLMYECREENRIRNADDDKTPGASARGSGFAVPTFANAQQQATASCPQGQVGNAVTSVVPAGQVISLVSQADADAKALSLALQQAGAQLNCVPAPVTYQNAPQSYTANCVGDPNAPQPTGGPVTKTIPAGQFSSIISQADADQQAMNAAQAAALAALQCTWFNSPQSFTATCLAPKTGTPVTVTIPAGAYTSTVSQSDANAQALNAATLQATNGLSCSGGTTVFYNTLVGGEYRQFCQQCSRFITVTWSVPAHTFASQLSQADANNQAGQYGNGLAQQRWQTLCSLCFGPGIGGGG